MLVLPMDAPYQTLLRGKVLSDHVFDTLEHFGQTNEIGCLLITALDKMRKGKDELRSWNSYSSATKGTLKFYLPFKKFFSLVATELRFLQTKLNVSHKWMNYNANRIPNLTGFT